MADKIYFFYCSLLSYSGFTIGFYGIMAKHKIDLETRIGMNKGYELLTDEGRAYFNRKYKNWKAGLFFDSQLASLIGILIALAGAGLNLIYNAWWSSILVILLAYIVYLKSANSLKMKVQILSVFTLFISIILIIIRLA